MLLYRKCIKIASVGLLLAAAPLFAENQPSEKRGPSFVER
jgi:hypothetical protein